MANTSCPPLEDLDFLNYDKSNTTQVQELENQWPCEIREFWKSSKIQDLVAVVRFLFNYVTILLVIIGLLLNICSLFVLNSPPINKSNMSVYLKALAVSDIGALLFNVSVGVLRAKSVQFNNIYVSNKWMCFMNKILQSVFIYYSIWLVVTFTFERMLMIRNSFKVQTLHSKKPAKMAVVTLAVAVLSTVIIRSITTTGFEIGNEYGFIPCGEEGHEQTSRRPNTLISNVVPASIIIFTNISLLIHVRQSAQDQSKLNATDDQRNTLKATRTVIVISIVYLIFYLPVGVIGCIQMLYRENEPPRENHMLHTEWAKNMLLLTWIRGLCFFIHLLNFVNNFFMYCVSGDLFRQTVKICVPATVRKIFPCLAETSIESRL